MQYSAESFRADVPSDFAACPEDDTVSKRSLKMSNDVISNLKQCNEIRDAKLGSADSPNFMLLPKPNDANTKTDPAESRSQSVIEFATAPSSATYFSSPVMQPKSRKRELIGLEEGPDAKVARSCSDDQQGTDASRQISNPKPMLVEEPVQTRDAATSPAPSNAASPEQQRLETPSSLLSYCQNVSVINGALTPPLSDNNSPDTNEDDWDPQAETGVDEKASNGGRSRSSSRSGSRSPNSSRSSWRSSDHGQSRSSRSRTRSRESSVSSVRSQSSEGWTTETLSDSHSSQSGSHRNSEQSVSPRSESRTGSEISERSFRTETRSDEYSPDERGYSSYSDDEDEQDLNFLVGPFATGNILAEAEHILSVYSPPIEE